MNSYTAVNKIKELSEFLKDLTKDAVIVGVDYYDTKVVESVAKTMVGIADSIAGLSRFLEAQALEERTKASEVGIPIKGEPGSFRRFEHVVPGSLKNDELEALIKRLQECLEERHAKTNP